jgi:hypothetical protein
MQKKSVRAVVLGVAGTIAMACAAQPAAALTVSPTGTYSHASAGTQTWTFSTTSQTFSCSNTTGSFAVAANGSGSSLNGNGLFGGCVSGIWGNVAITQTQAWPMQVQQTPVAGGVKVSLAFTVPNAGLKIVVAGACQLTLHGTMEFSRTVASLPTSITTADPLSVSRALVIDSAAGCSPLIASVGQGVTSTGASTLNRTMTVS